MKKYIKFLRTILDKETKYVFRENAAYEVSWENEDYYKIRESYVFAKQDEGNIFEIIKK